MKRYFVLVCFISLSFILKAQVSIIDYEASNRIYKDFGLTSEEVNFSFQGDTNAQIASLIIDKFGNIDFLYNGSGYYINLSSLIVDDNLFNVSFIKIWVGAEETSTKKSRQLFKYNVTVNKNNIIDKNTWLIRIPNVAPVLFLEDAHDSVKEFKNFYVKTQTKIKFQNTKESETIGNLYPSEFFDILDVVLDKDDDKIFWVKINYKKANGFIPLEALSENWTVIKNELKPGSYKTKQGVLNDSRVRLRTEPNLNSETLTYLTKGDTVKIIDRSTEMQKIGEDEAYWYKVEFEGYPDGWVYGKYVDVE